MAAHVHQSMSPTGASLGPSVLLTLRCATTFARAQNACGIRPGLFAYLRALNFFHLRRDHFPNLWARKYQFCVLLARSGVGAHTLCPSGQEIQRVSGKSTSKAHFTVLAAMTSSMIGTTDNPDLVTLSACSITVASFRMQTEDIAEPVQQQQMQVRRTLRRRRGIADNDPTGWQWTRPDTVLGMI